MDVFAIANQFNIQLTIDRIEPFGNGHINDTFRVVNKEAAGPDYLLQKINHQVFPQVAAMMTNIRRVTEHVNAKSPGSTLELILTKAGKNYFHDLETGLYWRMFLFRKSLLSYEVAETEDQIYEGAKSFGRFMKDLSDFPAAELVPIIPNFHNIIKRLQALKNAIAADTVHRVGQVEALIQFVFSVEALMTKIERAGQRGELPLRVTHNDTKFNNVLLDKEGKGRCVIDLETVMAGYVHYDFGDGIRTTVTTVEEDEPDLEAIVIQLDRFAAFARGFLSETRTILTPKEIEYLPLSGALLAYLMGVRFLTDYLQGDIYYKIHFPTQNLQRAQAQLNLTQKLIEQQGPFTTIIKGILEYV